MWCLKHERGSNMPIHEFIYARACGLICLTKPYSNGLIAFQVMRGQTHSPTIRLHGPLDDTARLKAVSPTRTCDVVQM